MVWLVAVVAIVLLIVFVPIGVRAKYDENGALVWITVGPFRSVFYPEKKNGTNARELASQFSKKKSVRGGKLSDFKPLFSDVLDLLSELKVKMRVKRLDCCLILAGTDPCDLAVNYGRAWTAIGNLMPLLERWFKIKKRNVEVECDFCADKTLVYANIHITISLIRLIKIILVQGSRIMKKYESIIEQRKGGANL